MAGLRWLPSECYRFNRLNKYCGLTQTTLQCRSISMESAKLPTLIDPKEEDVQYPPIKQKYPPGSWGNMSQFFAWRWNYYMETHQQIPTLPQRLEALRKLRRVWVLDAFSDVPHMLDYQQYVTKTKLIEGMPEFYSQINIDNELDNAKSLTSDALLHGLWNTVTTRRHRSQRTEEERLLAGDVIGGVIDTLVTALSAKHDYLARSQYDKDVKVEAIWDRFGFRARQPYIKYKEYDKKGMNEIAKDSRFQGSHMADILVRTEKPLQQIVARDDALCTKCTIPDYCYWPSVVGQRGEWRNGSTVPGHWLGNPCEFGQLSVLLTNTYRRAMRAFNDDVYADMEISAGMVSTFTWLVAQAHFQGFSSYADLTRPFCGQTILTDGRYVRFFASQLNTLALWKDNDGNPMQNLCWYSPKLPLYDRVEGGEIVGLNDEVVAWLLRFLLNEPREMSSERPLPADYVNPKDIDRLIDTKVEEVVVEEEEQLYD